MRSKFLGCLILLSSVIFGADALKDFTQELSKRQKTLLQDFLYTLSNSTAGYVIYGDKPMSIEVCDVPSLRFLSSPNARTVSLIKGKELWEDMQISPEDKEFTLTTYQNDTSCHFIVINRKAFLQAVRENLPLFQYVLGPAVTPENLFTTLTTAKNKFYQVLNEDAALIEILLGHGRQNAIVHSRMEYLTNPYSFGNKDEFPLISKKLSKSWAASSNKYRKKPSFGFSSVSDEEFALAKLVVSSEKVKSATPVDLPNFKCFPETEETKALISTYEKNRAAILKAVAKKDFLEETLRKFFSTVDKSLAIPEVPKPRDLCIPNNKAETIAKVVGILHKKIEMEPYAAKKFQAAFLQGVAAREKGKQMPIPVNLKRVSDVPTIERELECCKNLERANAYFAKLGEREDLVAIVPKEIYIKLLKSGKGNVASSKTNRVSFQYTYQILGDDASRDWGVVKDENLAALVPGVAYALIGMQQGEERVVYIHPKYAYGEDSFFPPNVSIVAQIRLLEFQEGEQSMAIFPAHNLEQRDYRDLLAKFEVLRGEEFFDAGVEFWDSIKKSGDYIDFESFQKIFTNFSSSPETTLNLPQPEQFVVDLEYLLMTLQKAS